MGLLASVGIAHDKPFEPDERMRKIIEGAVEVGNATARTVTFAARPEDGFGYCPGSEWSSALFVGGVPVPRPATQITADAPSRRPRATAAHRKPVRILLRLPSRPSAGPQALFQSRP
jgi:hypothetical protein